MGFEGGRGRLLVARSFTDTGLFETASGAAAGRHADENTSPAMIKIVIETALTAIFYTLFSIANYDRDV
jgi:hypothetical protein